MHAGREVIVLTPMKNESWVLRSFLEATLAWADHVIFRDQHSTDGSLEILNGIENVTILNNPSQAYNEAENRRALLEAARRRGPSNVLISLDVDERISGNILTNGFRDKLLALKPGTGIRIPFANLTPAGDAYWEVPLDPIGFVDDGRVPDTSAPIHFPRTCIVEFDQVWTPDDVKLMHLQYLDPERTNSKQRWYQMWELLNIPGTNPVKLYRRYHHRDSIPPKNYLPLPKGWLAPYKERGIDALAYEKNGDFWWDSEAKSWLAIHGGKRFCRVDIGDWRHNWLDETRGFDSLVLLYLVKTQKYYRPSKVNPIFLTIYFLDYLAAYIWRP